MITIKYDRKHYLLEVDGHAQSGEAGHDLVCSAVSILVYTAAANAERMSDEKSRFHKPKIEIEQGKATIKCRPTTGFKAVAKLAMDSVCIGFDILAQKYPAYVQYTVVG